MESETPPSYEALLRGVSHRPIEAKAVVKDLEEGDALLIEREDDNKFDANAIKVIHDPSGEFIGYVAKEIASDLAPWMDKGWHFTCNMSGRISSSIILLEINPILSEEESVHDEASAGAD